MVSVKEKFWEEWSKNFPVSATYMDEENSVFPKGVKFTRAGQTVFLTMEELAAFVWREPEEEAHNGRWDMGNPNV